MNRDEIKGKVEKAKATSRKRPARPWTTLSSRPRAAASARPARCVKASGRRSARSAGPSRTSPTRSTS